MQQGLYLVYTPWQEIPEAELHQVFNPLAAFGPRQELMGLGVRVLKLVLVRGIYLYWPKKATVNRISLIRRAVDGELEARIQALRHPQITSVRNLYILIGLLYFEILTLPDRIEWVSWYLFQYWLPLSWIRGLKIPRTDHREYRIPAREPVPIPTRAELGLDKSPVKVRDLALVFGPVADVPVELRPSRNPYNTYHRLQSLGDAVLDVITFEHLISTDSPADSSGISQLLTCNESFAELMRYRDLAKWVTWQQGKKVQADAFEALVGSLYLLDPQYPRVKEYVLNQWLLVLLTPRSPHLQVSGLGEEDLLAEVLSLSVVETSRRVRDRRDSVVQKWLPLLPLLRDQGEWQTLSKFYRELGLVINVQVIQSSPDWIITGRSVDFTEWVTRLDFVGMGESLKVAKDDLARQILDATLA